ncbi:P-type conjugative transfer protein TrbJ [Stutzerimonas chloritidismutans]|uniref:P-type conjugative transfer protein TrbJ n=1 Tax=Stutzerimonas chloritidismutans TaxID=203192 RepID=UPI001D1989A7|nr:P-type conjugative transfer protein TrbJ [Stutzerimonas chloritidismutans]UEG63229.1 P-type conjugative transfer protein TrbJ [Stutzerimonas chloritidismutans]
MTLQRLVLHTVVLLCVSAIGHARAITVIDPTNLAQNTLTAVRTLEMTNNQISQLHNETQMLLNQARNLAALDFNAVNRLRQSIRQSEQLLAEATGLAYEVSRLDQAFARLYPERYAASITGSDMAAHSIERWSQAREGVHTALRMQAQLSQDLALDEAALTDLVSQSQSAVGALQASQATNQLLALQAKQVIQAQQLAIAQHRAVSIGQARQVAVEHEARERRKRFMASGTFYSPRPVRVFAP